MDPIRRDLEEELGRIQKELDERISNNPYEEEPASCGTILGLLALVVVFAIAYVIVSGGGF